MQKWAIQKWTLITAPLTLFASLCLYPSIADAQRYDPQVGDVHEDFVLPDIATGKPRRLSDFRGTKVLLIHFASW
jgi:hypothetical protein